MGEPQAGISTRFTKACGIVHPIACAGMAFATLSPSLPIAVSRAGALGTFAAGILPVEAIRRNLRAIRAAVRAPLHLNLITPFAGPEHIDLCLEEGVDIVSFHWTHPPETWLSRLRAAKIRIWQQVGEADAARRALDSGAELVIAQGIEAGGHSLARVPTFIATPAIIDAASGALVLAAGGIVDGRGLAAALALGADGAWIGTRLLATDESDVADVYKQRILESGVDDTVLTSLFGRERPDFNPMRVIRNQAVRDAEAGATAGDPEAEPIIGRTRIEGMELPVRRGSSLPPVRGSEGELGSMAMPAGQGAGRIRDIVPAAVAIQRIVREAADILHGLAAATTVAAGSA